MNRAWLALLACAACKPALPASTASVSISVSASLPGAQAETITSSIAIPLERQFGQIQQLHRLTSRSSFGAATLRLEFAPGTDPMIAAQAVQAAITAATPLLPPTMPTPPTYSKSGRDAAVLRLALSSATLPLDQLGTLGEDLVAQKLSQVAGVGLVTTCGAARDRWRVEVDPERLAAENKQIGDVIAEVGEPAADTRAFTPGPLVRDVAVVTRGGGWPDCIALDGGIRSVVVSVQPQPLADRTQTLARLEELVASIRTRMPPGVAVHELVAEPLDVYELATGSDELPVRRAEQAREVAEQLARAGVASLVELGVDRDGEPAPETIVVRAAGDRARIGAILGRTALALTPPGAQIVGLSGPDVDQLHDTLAQLVAALRKTTLPVYGTLGDDREVSATVTLDRDRMMELAVTVRDVDTALQAIAGGITATTVFGQTTMTPVLVTIAAPHGEQLAEQLQRVYVRSASGSAVPLATFTTVQTKSVPSVVIHEGQFPWVGVRVGGTRAELDAALAAIAVPRGIVRGIEQP
jgi:multidrug efflux pump subunit AcrB